MGLGEKFKNERERQGFSLAEIEEETKIRKLYLDAIEKEEFATLPPRVYATGFVKRYAKFLGLNERQIVEEFKYLAYGSEEDEDEVITSQCGMQKGLPLKNIIAAILFLAAAIWIGNYLVDFFAGRGATPLPQDTPPPVAEPANPNQQEEVSEPQPAALARVEVEAQQRCWLLVVVDQEKQFEGNLSAGDKKVFEGSQSVYLKAGNAGGIEVTYNGEEMAPFGRNGEVAEQTFTAQ